MSERLKTGVYAGAVSLLAVVVLVLVATAPDVSDRVDTIGSRIKCPVCQGESIANSPSQMARDMMDLVRSRVVAGASDETIIDELLQSYSGAVLLDPPPSGDTLILWLSPLVALAVGGTVIAWWTRHPPSRSGQVEASNSKGRSVVGGVGLAVALAAVVVVAGFSLQQRDGPASGVASLDQDDLALVSNETLEAVVAANLDHPEIDGMRLALAARYVEEADYGAALDHYLAVAGSQSATSSEIVVALIQMGRLVWDGNADAEVAISLFDEALEIDPASAAALYYKAVVTWCGLDDPEQAATLLATVLAADSPEVLADGANADLEAIERGEACA